VKVGCSSDRECILANDNPLSVCTDKKCRVPCQMDVECNRTGVQGVAACVSGQCVDIGCETEDDCRAMYSATTATKTHWLCQPPTP
jgi:hypothetical protein